MRLSVSFSQKPGLLALSISLVEECLSFSKLVSGGFLN